MKKTLALVLIAALAFAGVAFSAEEYFPGKNHSGSIGKSSRVWQYGYFDYLRLYGGSSTYYGAPAIPTLTANRTWTFPDATGTVGLNCSVTHNYAATSADWTLSTAESYCSALIATNASAAVNIILPTALVVPGKPYTIANGSGQIVTFKVSGKTGGTVAAAKNAHYYASTADVYEVHEES